MLGTHRLLLVAACLLTVMGALSEAHDQGHHVKEKRNKIRKPKRPKGKKLKVTKTEEEFALKEAHETVVQTHILEHDLFVQHVVLSPKCPGFRNSVFKKAKKSSLRKADLAEEALAASLNIARKKHLSRNDRKFSLAKIPLSASVFDQSCFKQKVCNASDKYRTIDGSCNNLQHPKWGQAETAFLRLLDPDYGNGLTSPRLASDDSYLPSARTVSNRATCSKNDDNFLYTHMLMQWGQFLDHDITHTPVVTAPDDFEISCCPTEINNEYSQRLHPACFPIQVPTDDVFFSKFNVTCMELTRSLPALRKDCTYGPREQMNELTAYIDASNVYGSLHEESHSLRLFKGGELKTQRAGGKDLLPANPDDEACEREDYPCFLAGDVRVNEQPNLAIMHTLWMKQHNKIARELQGINPFWDDEKLFQETRRIVGAQMQHITYNEWLPIILGKGFMRRNKLEPKKFGYSYSYDSTVDASISNAFATAAFRFGHSLIQPYMKAFSSKNESKSYALHDVASKPGFLYKLDSFDSFLFGLIRQSSQAFDNSFPKEIKNRLFAKGESFGLDLISLNIQRGRDHGLPPYVMYRATCGLSVVNSWKDLEGVFEKTNIEKLRNTYKSVLDIDLFIGGVMEKTSGGLTGDTFRCIIGDQFKRLKTGDRFFYENGVKRSTRFSPNQLNEIRKTTLARILCDNGDRIGEVQPNVFKTSDKKYNKLLKCDNYEQIPALDIFQWKEF